MENLASETGRKFKNLLDAVAENSGFTAEASNLGPSVGDDATPTSPSIILGPCVGD